MSEVKNGIKLLVAGFEASGKTTLIADLDDALVINCDGKEFTLKGIPVVNIKGYSGYGDFTDKVNSAIAMYKEKKGKFPKYIVFDTITQLQIEMVAYSQEKFTGFQIWGNVLKEARKLNTYFETILIPNGVSVIILAHTVVDEATGRYIIPASGQFRDSGSWLSIVNEAIFIDKHNKRNIILADEKYPARSTLDEYKPSKDKPSIKIARDEFNLKDYCEKLIQAKSGVEEFIL